MKKYLGLSTILAASVLLTACSDDKPTSSKPTSGNTTITSSTNNPASSSETKTNSSSEAPVSETTTSQAGSEQTTNTTTTKAPAAENSTKANASSKINVGTIAGGNLSSVVGTYPALNGGTYTIKDNKTIIYKVDGQEKVLTVTGYGQQEGAAVINAVFSSIDGKKVDANTPSAGDLGATFYFVPAGQKSPAGFVIGNDNTSKDRVVTLNNAFFLN